MNSSYHIWEVNHQFCQEIIKIAEIWRFEKKGDECEKKKKKKKIYNFGAIAHEEKIKLAKMRQNLKSSDRFRTVSDSSVTCQFVVIWLYGVVRTT